MVQLVGLDTYHLSRYPHELSGGQKRIGIKPISSFAMKLFLLWMYRCRHRSFAEVKRKIGLTYFFISHNLNVVYQISDRVGVMHPGKMAEIARIADFSRKTVSSIYRGVAFRHRKSIRRGSRSGFV